MELRLPSLLPGHAILQRALRLLPGAAGRGSPRPRYLMQRLDWLAARGVRTIHFCGGEPTIHPALAELIGHVRGQGGSSQMTTNGIALPAQCWLPCAHPAQK